MSKDLFLRQLVGALQEFSQVKMPRGTTYGENPHQNPPTGDEEHYDKKDYQPGYVALLYLGLNPDWSIRVNHASFALQAGNTPLDRLTRAVEAFYDITYPKIAGKNRFRDYHQERDTYFRIKDQAYDMDSFDGFKFKTQNEIFIFIHQLDFGTSGKKGIVLDKNELVSFGLIGGKGGPNPFAADWNYSFFNARAVKANDIDSITQDSKLSDIGEMIRIENWVREEHGAKLTSDQHYSMDINFSIPGSGGVFKIPMVIDPDTGNGTGNEP